ATLHFSLLTCDPVPVAAYSSGSYNHSFPFSIAYQRDLRRAVPRINLVRGLQDSRRVVFSHASLCKGWHLPRLRLAPGLSTWRTPPLPNRYGSTDQSGLQILPTTKLHRLSVLTPLGNLALTARFSSFAHAAPQVKGLRQQSVTGGTTGSKVRGNDGATIIAKTARPAFNSGLATAATTAVGGGNDLVDHRFSSRNLVKTRRLAASTGWRCFLGRFAVRFTGVTGCEFSFLPFPESLRVEGGAPLSVSARNTCNHSPPRFLTRFPRLCACFSDEEKGLLQSLECLGTCAAKAPLAA
ncbi:MAG: hypothetical protein BJ554DRAFT_6648, partial [Olpidium bornovanus]